MLEEDQTSLFTDWLEKHSSSVIQVARAYTLNNDECQDLAQEILLQAWRSLPKFEGKASAATWFYRVALHTAMNWKRNDKRRRTFQKPLIIEEVADGSAAKHAKGHSGDWYQATYARNTNVADTVEQVMHRETVEQLYKAIRQLPKTDAALVLLYLDELTYREMAEVLGISESNVGVKLNRAKNTLNILMKGASDES